MTTRPRRLIALLAAAPFAIVAACESGVFEHPHEATWGAVVAGVALVVGLGTWPRWWCWLFHGEFRYSDVGAYRGMLGLRLRPPIHCLACEKNERTGEESER